MREVCRHLANTRATLRTNELDARAKRAQSAVIIKFDVRRIVSRDEDLTNPQDADAFSGNTSRPSGSKMSMSQSSHFIVPRNHWKEWLDDVINGDVPVLIIERTGSRVARDERRGFIGRAEGEPVGSLDDKTGPREIITVLNATGLGDVGRHRRLEALCLIRRRNNSAKIRKSSRAFYPSNHGSRPFSAVITTALSPA